MSRVAMKALDDWSEQFKRDQLSQKGRKLISETMSRLNAYRHDAKKARRAYKNRTLQSNQTKILTVKIGVRRDYEHKGSKKGFYASACLAMPKVERASRYPLPSVKRCDYAFASSPTAAIRKAMTGLTRKIK